MAAAVKTVQELDYKTYRFGRSKQRFRGPQPDLTQPYVAFIGGSEPFGKFVEKPFPAILGQKLDYSCVNWGTPGAGPSFFLRDPVVLEACSKAKVCVITVMGAVAMSNRLYSVFKRRNSRIRDTSKTLKALYPNMKLGDFRFAHNMLRKMHQGNPENFKVVEIELREAWVARMRELLEEIETTRVLLWMSARAPEEEPRIKDPGAFTSPPAFVNREMIEKVAPMADILVEYVAGHGVANMPGDGRIFTEDQADAALRYPGQTMHNQVADLLADPLKQIVAINQPLM